MCALFSPENISAGAVKGLMIPLTVRHGGGGGWYLLPAGSDPVFLTGHEN